MYKDAVYHFTNNGYHTCLKRINYTDLIVVLIVALRQNIQSVILRKDVLRCTQGHTLTVATNPSTSTTHINKPTKSETKTTEKK